MKSSKKQIETKINSIKQKLIKIGEMRPGSLSKQYNVCGVAGCRCKDPVNPQKHGPYHQLSYTHNKKSTTRFIRQHQVTDVKSQLAQYKKFKELMDQWVALAIELADINLATTRDQAHNKSAK